MHPHKANLSLLATDTLLSMFHRFFRNNPHMPMTSPIISCWKTGSLLMGWLQCETWALSLQATFRTDSGNISFLYSELLWAWSQKRINNKTQPHIYYSIHICSGWLCYKRNGHVKWKYWIQPSPTLKTAIMFCQDSLQSVWQPKEKEAYMDKTPEKPVWERKKLLTVWIFCKHIHLLHLQRKLNRTSKCSHFIPLKINVHLLHSIWCRPNKKIKVFQTMCFHTWFSFMHTLDFLLCTHLPDAGVISVQTTTEVWCCCSGTSFQVLR